MADSSTLQAAMNWHRSGDFERAETVYRQILQGEPNNADAQHLLGVVAYQRGNSLEAIEWIRRAIALDDSVALYYCNLGSALRSAGEFDAAVVCFERALEMESGDSELRDDFFGVSLDDLLADHLGSDAGENTAKENTADDAALKYQRALTLLAQGDFARGWDDYEQRWEDNAAVTFRHPMIPRHPTIPQWDGSAPYQQQLLVTAEQRIDDNIMFASCLPDLLPHTKRSVVECDERLVSLFARSFPLATVVPCSERNQALISSCDRQVALGTLPRYLRQSSESFPAVQRFLAPDQQQVERWKQRFAELGNGLKIGISWRDGNSEENQQGRKNDDDCSTSLEQWKSVFQIAGVHFINVQQESQQDEVATARRDLGVVIHDWNEVNFRDDFDQFAAQIAALDLVISVDSSTAHLAGAVGVPVWTLLPFAANWRWLADRNDTVWYSTMRLFRQQKTSDWELVFTNIVNELVTLLGKI